MPEQNENFVKENMEKILQSPSYRRAYEDFDFLNSDPVRSLRLMTEFVKPDISFLEHRIESTIIVFGSARIISPEDAQKKLTLAKKESEKSPHSSELRKKVDEAEDAVKMSHYYVLAEKFAELVSSRNPVIDYNASQKEEYEARKKFHYVICTGGGPGIMEAANRGAYNAGSFSIGLNITLPYEQKPNPYITPDLCFQFHYFAMRKLHFLLRARALVAFPGGFGTFDELFECLTLRQTGKMQKLPIILFGKEYWEKAVNFDYLAETGMISKDDLKIFKFADTPEEALDSIIEFFCNEKD